MSNSTPIIDALNSLKQAEQEALVQLSQVQEAIALLEKRNNVVKLKSGANEYNFDWPLPTKFLYLLKKYNRFLHFREAANMIIDIEGNGDVKELTAKLSAGSILLKSSNQIVKFKATKSLQDTFWGSPKWLDKDGNIIPGHEFNKDYLYEGGKKAPLIEI